MGRVVSRFFAWWSRLWARHRHEFQPVATTYAPPADSLSFYWLPNAERERAVHGVTTILYRCHECGAMQSFQMLGSKQAPPSTAKLVPIRKEDRF